MGIWTLEGGDVESLSQNCVEKIYKAVWVIEMRDRSSASWTRWNVERPRKRTVDSSREGGRVEQDSIERKQMGVGSLSLPISREKDLNFELRLSSSVPRNK